MDDEEVELSHLTRLSNPSSSSNIGGSTSAGEFLENAATCTHTHTCNPPGPDASHTHTCFHTHTHVFSSGTDGASPQEKNHPASMRPSGNREAVRKYREKKKAHAAYLEEEVKKLRVLNQQLVWKLQGQAILEAEILRLRSLLVDIRGNIDKELGGFPFKRHCHTRISMGEGECDVPAGGVAVSLPCLTDIPCFNQPVRHITRMSSTGGTGKLMFCGERNFESAVENCEVDAIDISSTADRSLTADTLVSSTSLAE